MIISLIGVDGMFGVTPCPLAGRRDDSIPLLSYRCTTGSRPFLSARIISGRFDGNFMSSGGLLNRRMASE